MLDNIRWIFSIVTSVLMVWVLFMVNQSLPHFINTMLFYGAAALATYVLSELIYSETGRLQNKLATYKTPQQKS